MPVSLKYQKGVFLLVTTLWGPLGLVLRSLLFSFYKAAELNIRLHLMAKSRLLEDVFPVPGT
jgi:hypothetical protein